MTEKETQKPATSPYPSEILFMDTESEKKLDELHNKTIENLYEVFEEEFDTYFKFKALCLSIMEKEYYFPFSTNNDSCYKNLDNCLNIVERNIFKHIEEQLEILFDEKKEDKSKYCIDASIQIKEFENKMRSVIHKFIRTKKV